MSKTIRRRAPKAAHTLLEESIALLRERPEVLLSYFVGAVPFWLGFLYFFSDMSQSAYAGERLVGGALVLALLYLWKKCWQTVFASQLRAHLLLEPDAHWNWGRIFRLIVAQAAWQPIGLILRPVALVITLPFVWVSSFFQNVTILGDGRRPPREQSLAIRAWSQAQLWPAQAHLVVVMLSLFGMFIWLNVMSAIVVAPSLLKMLFDVETAASRNLLALIFNSTFLSASLALTMLFLDPIWKTAYVLRCFYGESLRTGEDLLATLKTVERQGRSGAAIVVAMLCLLLSPISAPAQSAPGAGGAPSAEIARAEQIASSLDDVLQEREYAWRMPREEGEKGEKSILAETVSKWLKSLREAIDRFMNWLKKLMDPIQPPAGSGPSGLPVQWITYALVALGVLGLAWAVWTVIRNTRKTPVAATAVQALPDLHGEDVVADQLPVDGWLRMMHELLNSGELRLALRAAYLATLAHLGDRDLLSIARFKSNHDYQRELQRRARSREQLLGAFEENLRVFERSWYGQHEVTRELLARFSQNLEIIRAC